MLRNAIKISGARIKLFSSKAKTDKINLSQQVYDLVFNDHENYKLVVRFLETGYAPRRRKSKKTERND